MHYCKTEATHKNPGSANEWIKLFKACFSSSSLRPWVLYLFFPFFLVLFIHIVFLLIRITHHLQINTKIPPFISVSFKFQRHNYRQCWVASQGSHLTKVTAVSFASMSKTKEQKDLQSAASSNEPLSEVILDILHVKWERRKNTDWNRPRTATDQIHASLPNLLLHPNPFIHPSLYRLVDEVMNMLKVTGKQPSVTALSCIRVIAWHRSRQVVKRHR